MIKKSPYIGISLIIILIIFIGTVSRADTIDELQSKIDAANKNRELLEKEITSYQSQLKVIGEKATSLQTTIKSLDVSTNKITTEVKLVENNINKTTYTIEDTGIKIKDKEEQINKGLQAITETIKQIDEIDSRSIWEMLLSNENLSDFWTDIENSIKIQAKISDQVNIVRDIKTSLELAKVELEQNKNELEDYNKDLSNQKKVLQSTKNEKSSLLSATKNTEANYQKLLAANLAKKAALDQEINAFESQLRLVIDPKSIPPAGKGILAWPLDSIFVTQNFGKTSDSGRLYVSGTHNGVDFRASIGTRIKSAGNGVVEGVGDTDIVCSGASFGKWVFIRYDNGLASIYGHLSLITAKPGQKVQTGDVVGYSGYTGYVDPQGPGGAHLHMSVYASQGVKVDSFASKSCPGKALTMPLADTRAYLDPLIYL